LSQFWTNDAISYININVKRKKEEEEEERENEEKSITSKHNM
jgi:hypothetical protein